MPKIQNPFLSFVADYAFQKAGRFFCTGASRRGPRVRPRPPASHSPAVIGPTVLYGEGLTLRIDQSQIPKNLESCSQFTLSLSLSLSQTLFPKLHIHRHSFLSHKHFSFCCSFSLLVISPLSFFSLSHTHTGTQYGYAAYTFTNSHYSALSLSRSHTSPPEDYNALTQSKKFSKLSETNFSTLALQFFLNGKCFLDSKSCLVQPFLGATIGNGPKILWSQIGILTDHIIYNLLFTI